MRGARVPCLAGHLTEDRFTDVQTPLEMHEWSTVKLSKQHGSSVMEIFVNGIKVGENIWPLEDITCPSRVYLGGLSLIHI